MAGYMGIIEWRVAKLSISISQGGYDEEDSQSERIGITS